jgi:hypothetical protein
MHKKTKEGEIMEKLAKNHSLEAKREIFVGKLQKCDGQVL